MVRKVTLAGTALAGSLAWCGLAAAQPVSGLYVGAVGGASFMEHEQVRVSPITGLPPLYGKAGFDTGYAALGSIGWGFGNGFRAEVEGNYRRNDFGRNQGGLAAGGRESKYGGMVNALFDLDIGSPYVYPYIGGGVGYQWVNQRATVSAGPYSALVDSSKGAFAYQAIAGVSFPIPPVVGLSFLAEYRYFNVVSDRDYGVGIAGPGLAVNGRVREKADFNHSLLVGLRYAFNVAPPPVEPQATVSPPPSAEAARTYLVFFDWDRADLTPRARQVVAEAAKATTRVQVTRIEVNGYTDTSGTPRYNQGLSVRRAQAVANALVVDGVPKQAISIQGYGETRLLVPTADGVREPQNRRVEIILH